MDGAYECSHLGGLWSISMVKNSEWPPKHLVRGDHANMALCDLLMPWHFQIATAQGYLPH
jgi:hypothetical protein